MDIYVGSLPFKIKENALKEIFEKYGEVASVKIIIDKITRQNKGFGFITMPDDEAAELAIEALNGTEIMERQIIVSKSEPAKADNKYKRNFGKGNANFKSDFDKTKKSFPGKSGFQKGGNRGRR